MKDNVNKKPMTNDTMIHSPRHTVGQFHGQYADICHNDNKCNQQYDQHNKYLCKHKI